MCLLGNKSCTPSEVCSSSDTCICNRAYPAAMLGEHSCLDQTALIVLSVLWIIASAISIFVFVLFASFFVFELLLERSVVRLGVESVVGNSLVFSKYLKVGRSPNRGQIRVRRLLTFTNALSFCFMTTSFFFSLQSIVINVSYFVRVDSENDLILLYNVFFWLATISKYFQYEGIFILIFTWATLDVKPVSLHVKLKRRNIYFAFFAITTVLTACGAIWYQHKENITDDSFYHRMIAGINTTILFLLLVVLLTFGRRLLRIVQCKCWDGGERQVGRKEERMIAIVTQAYSNNPPPNISCCFAIQPRPKACLLHIARRSKKMLLLFEG